MLTRLSTIAALLIALVAAPAARAADEFDLDQSHFSIVFSVSHMNMSYTYGMFRKAEATVTLDRQNPSASQFQFRIYANTIDTNNTQRDDHLKGPDFFNVATYPDITFQSTSVARQNDPQRMLYLVTGDLTMHGVTKQVTLPIEMLGEGAGPDGRPHAGFLMQTELKRSDFGITRNLENGVVGDMISITVSFEGIKR